MYKADIHIVYNQTYRIPMLLKFDEVGQLGKKIFKTVSQKAPAIPFQSIHPKK